MKKLFLALLVALPSFVQAAATATPTNTFTQTPTFTPTAVAVLPQSGTNSLFLYPENMYQANNAAVITGSLTPLPGDTTVWVASSLNQNAAVFSTGTAVARVKFTVPMDYSNVNGGLRLFAHGVISTIGVTTTAFCANVFTAGMNKLTSTAGSYLGVTFNVKTGEFISSGAISLTTQTGERLLDARFSRFLIPISGTVAQILHPGDTGTIELVRAAGATGNVSVNKVELQYVKVNGRGSTSGR
jgi:hypothetical protein